MGFFLTLLNSLELSVWVGRDVQIDKNELDLLLLVV